MVGVLVLYILGIAAIIVVPGAGFGYVGYRLLRPWWRRRQARALAKKRALFLEAPKCSICLEAVDQLSDCYDDHLGWYHHNCYKTLVG